MYKIKNIYSYSSVVEYVLRLHEVPGSIPRATSQINK